MKTKLRTVCFADIERFNVGTRNMDPKALVGFLQGFYECAGNVLLSHNGRLIKYIGDAVLATFDDGREEIAVRAMWTLRESFRAYRESVDSKEAQVSGLRVGIATGEVFAGQIGHPDMLAYDVLGKPVVVAAALRRCGGITIDGATYNAVKGHVLAEPSSNCGELRGYEVKGFQ